MRVLRVGNRNTRGLQRKSRATEPYPSCESNKTYFGGASCLKSLNLKLKMHDSLVV